MAPFRHFHYLSFAIVGLLWTLQRDCSGTNRMKNPVPNQQQLIPSCSSQPASPQQLIRRPPLNKTQPRKKYDKHTSNSSVPAGGDTARGPHSPCRSPRQTWLSLWPEARRLHVAPPAPGRLPRAWPALGSNPARLDRHGPLPPTHAPSKVLRFVRLIF
ncbi:hypothetical protein B0T17DRAFT_117210 [Bombardia bombarda]|uniref:Secreted protein n=1 Tax=Bombardia bombarda TaxID=252184 RepID=A0AA39W9U4_9PEZI|nr:hypothetical protein B0T17DRAFT_117210 [Bombardia bombarda]